MEHSDSINSYNNQRSFVIAGLSILFSIIATFFILFLVSKNYTVPDYTTEIKNIFAVDDSFLPEPLERLLFIIGTLVLPIILFFSHLMFKKVTCKFIKESHMKIVSTTLFCALGFSSVFLFFTNLQEFSLFSQLASTYFTNYLLIKLPVLIFIIITSIFYLWKNPNKLIIKNPFPNKITHAHYIDIVSIILILFVSVLFVFSKYTISENWIALDFNYVFLPVSAAFQGKQVLVDILSQYGLFPHLLEPIYSVIGLSVLKFSLTLAILIAISLYSIHKFLNEIVQEKFLALLGFISIVYISILHWRIPMSPPELIYFFYQYHPIRFLFPTISIYLTWKYFNGSKNNLFYYSLFFLYSIGILWNTDSGVVVFLSWILVLIYNEFYQVNFKTALINILKHIAVGIAILATTVLLYALCMKLRYGTLPKFSQFLFYQSLYYKYGYYMLPMKIVHAWNLLILTYIIGFSQAIKALIDNKNTPKATMVAFLSILGVGVFNYYQGRSADGIILIVSYPALVLLSIFADDILSKIKNNRSCLVYNSMFIGILFVFAISIFNILMSIPFLTNNLKLRMQTMVAQKPTQITRSIDFIKENTHRNDNILILSQNDGLYYLGIDSYYTPRIMHFRDLQKDYSVVFDWLENESIDNKIFLDQNFLSTDPSTTIFNGFLKTYKFSTGSAEHYPKHVQFKAEILKRILKYYVLIDINSDKNIMLFSKKPTKTLKVHNERSSLLRARYHAGFATPNL